jgi:hypothetical protein
MVDYHKIVRRGLRSLRSNDNQYEVVARPLNNRLFQPTVYPSSAADVPLRMGVISAS